MAMGSTQETIKLTMGLACSTILPAVSYTHLNLLSALRRLRAKLHLPATLQEAGVEPQQLQAHMPQLLHAAMQDACLQTNPRPASEADLRGILQEVLQHG